MIEVEDSIVIARPIGEVFTFVADQTNAPRWQDGLLEVRRITDGPPGVGTRHVAVRRFMGRKLELTNEYVHYEPNTKITFTGASGPSSFEAAYLTDTTADGTRVTCRMRMEQRGLFKLGDPLVVAGLRREFAVNLENLKGLLETKADGHLPTKDRVMRVDRSTIDLSGYPDLVVVYLGMRVNRPRGLLRMLGLGPQINRSWKDKPDGLLLHEDFIWSLLPPHAGMRQYWRDLDSLERWTRSDPHRLWWRTFLRDSGGTGFWHETYFMRGGVEAIYDDMAEPTGLARVAPHVPARGAMFSARRRAGDTTPATVAPVVLESDYYADEPETR